METDNYHLGSAYPQVVLSLIIKQYKEHVSDGIRDRAALFPVAGRYDAGTIRQGSDIKKWAFFIENSSGYILTNSRLRNLGLTGKQ